MILDGRAELTGYDLASISCLGSVYMKPDQTVKIAARGVSFSSVSHFSPICHRLFHLISAELYSLTHKYPA